MKEKYVENDENFVFFLYFLKVKEMINWRQLYNESQAIQPEDTDVSTEVIDLAFFFVINSNIILTLISVFVGW